MTRRSAACVLRAQWKHAPSQAQNPNAAPTKGFEDGTSPLTGEWKLIFTSALDVLSLGLLPGIDVGQVFQNINEDGTKVSASLSLDRTLVNISSVLVLVQTRSFRRHHVQLHHHAGYSASITHLDSHLILRVFRLTGVSFGVAAGDQSSKYLGPQRTCELELFHPLRSM